MTLQIMLKFTSIIVHGNSNCKGQRTEVKIRFEFCQMQLLLNEDMILALAGQFKQLPREPEKFR